MCDIMSSIAAMENTNVNVNTTQYAQYVIVPSPMVGMSPAVSSPATTVTSSGIKLAKILPSTAKPAYSGTPPMKPPKKNRDEDCEILRCKRRLDFARLGLPIQRPNPVTVARRNERERNRVKLINSTFTRLRDHIPHSYNKVQKSKKMSKVDTLKNAIEYIRNLQEVLEENDAVSAVLDNSQTGFQNFQSHLSIATMNMNTPAMPMSLPASSPSSTCSSVESVMSDAPFSPEEEDLLDFASWFQ